MHSQQAQHEGHWSLPLAMLAQMSTEAVVASRRDFDSRLPPHPRRVPESSPRTDWTMAMGDLLAGRSVLVEDHSRRQASKMAHSQIDCWRKRDTTVILSGRVAIFLDSLTGYFEDLPSVPTGSS